MVQPLSGNMHHTSVEALPGVELIEIRHQASHGQILETPPTLFVSIKVPLQRLHYEHF